MQDSNQSVLFLLTTSGCSLCNKAKIAVWPALSQFGLKLEEVDIIDYPPLLQHFAVKIPVLCLAGSVGESPRQRLPESVLEWPFDESQLHHWLMAQGLEPQN